MGFINKDDLLLRERDLLIKRGINEQNEGTIKREMGPWTIKRWDFGGSTMGETKNLPIGFFERFLSNMKLYMTRKNFKKFIRENSVF